MNAERGAASMHRMGRAGRGRCAFAASILALVGPWTAMTAANAQAQRQHGATFTQAPAFSAMRLGPIGRSDQAAKAADDAPHWRFIGLPRQTKPATRFEVVEQDGRRVMSLAADASYGNLVWGAGGLVLEQSAKLRWSWRLDRGLPRSDLSQKAGDDSPLKVCASFDMPIDGLSFGERARLRIARTLSGEPLPSATLCYLWDRLLPEGTLLANAFTERVRFVVASSGEARVGQWITQERPLAQDFLRAFGHETKTLPPLSALLVGADADNTQGSSLGYVGDVTLAP